ncbi:MAG TPA: AAA family ATPase [Gaiellales bacterium]|nr:AAA family ATPase [Gaiellales bacterium]
MLVGRVEECTSVDRLLEEARAGRGGALAICGEPGIGKTSLLDYAAGRADGMRIVHARGVQSETTVPFAALVDLLTPLVEAIGALPERQAEALESALAIGPPRPADRLAVLVGGFNLLCAAAAAQPLLVLVDDAHWLDAASAEAIGFAARRIGADPIALVIASRTPGLPGIPSLQPRPLTAGQSRDLLERRGLTPTGLETAVRDAAGNPLALVELATFDDGRFEAGRSTLEEAYAAAVATLPDSCRAALLLLATGRSEGTAVIGLAAQGLSDAAFAPAERAGLVQVEPGRIRFRHPLIRTAVSAAAIGPDRRRAHEALALACVEPELEWERIGHRAAAAVEPDEELAAAVERLASDVGLRGGAVATIEWYQRAGGLSADPAERRRRLLLAAEAAHVSGRAEPAYAILDEVESESRSPTDVARVEILRGRIEARSSSTLTACTRLLRTAQRLEAADPVAAAALFIESVDPSIRAGRPQQALTAAGRALDLAPPGDALALAARIARAASLVFLGDAAGAECDIEAAADQAASAPQVGSDLQLRAYVCMTLAFAERIDRAGAALDELIDECEQTAPGALTYPLISRAWLRRITGAWDGAQADCQRAVRLARQLGRANDECWGLSILTWLGVAQGRPDEEMLAHQESLSERLDLPYQRMCVQACRGLHALASGDAQAAAAALGAALMIKRECEIEDATTHPVLGADLVEALARCGRADDAAAEAAALQAAATRSGRDSALALAERARALVSEDGADHFQRAWELHAETADRFARGRTALAWGDALRRAGARVESRRMLEAARAEFERLGAAPWEEQATSALARSGKVLRKEAARRDELTPAELEVASLVAEGKMNKEIAAALWISEKTVEAHLSRIFRKLGIRNRAELAGRQAGGISPMP